MKNLLVGLFATIFVLLGMRGLAAAQEKCPYGVSGTIAAGDGTQTGHLKNGQPSACITPKAVPDVMNGDRRFDSYTLKNRSSANACVTATVKATTNGEQVASAAYVGAFDPTNIQANYLGDSGNVGATATAYSFLVPALATFVVTVSEAGTNGATYDLAITDCGSIVATGINPNTGFATGGTAITVTGSGFVAGATVTIGGAPAVGVNVTNESTITATTPPGVAGTADVVVTNPDNSSSTLTGAFSYVAATGTLVALTSSANPTVVSQTVTFTAMVTSTLGTPTGSVTFKDGATTLGNGTLNGSGVATLATSNFTIGTHPITAEYAGNGTVAAGTSAAVSQVVTQAKSATSVVASANPAGVGSTVVFTVAVAAAAPATGIPTGNVNVSADGTAIGVASGVAIDNNGKAAISTASIPEGTHTIVATYSGDAKFASSVSAPFSLVVGTPPADAGASSSSGSTSSTSSGATSTSSGNAATPAGAGGGGCDCRTTSSGANSAFPILFGLAALLAATRRRRQG